MCNDYGNRISYSQYVEGFSQVKLPVRFNPPRPNLEPRDEIWPTENAPVVRLTEGGAELVQLRWGLAARPGAKPVINMRSEGRRFENGRCLVPASHYFEFTGAKSPKTRWKFTRSTREGVRQDGAKHAGACSQTSNGEEDWFCFAGLLGKALTKEGEVQAFSLLTVAPGPDTNPYHDREPAILFPNHWRGWLEGGAASQLLQSSQPGCLRVIKSPREKE
jgi:putative SOS response-associated peptidase YedK